MEKFVPGHQPQRDCASTSTDNESKELQMNEKADNKVQMEEY